MMLFVQLAIIRICPQLFLICLSVVVNTCAQDNAAWTREAQTVGVESFGMQRDGIPLLVLLHGVNGPSQFYTDQAKFFAEHGFRVILPHFFEAGRGTASTDQNYDAWISMIRAVTAREVRNVKPGSVQFLGFSLGASIALAIGSQGAGPGAVVEFYGSLPDRYYRDLVSMPPLLILHGERDTNVPVGNALQLYKLCGAAEFRCEMHIYSEEGHTFSPKNMRDADLRALHFLLTESDRRTGMK